MLNFEGSAASVQFKGNGVGKIGTTGYVLGLVGGIHLGFALLSGIFLYCKVFKSDGGSSSNLLNSSMVTLFHWSIYISLLCIFHFLEFFATAVNQPRALCFDCT